MTDAICFVILEKKRLTMIRKFLGFSLVVAVLCLVGCGSSTNADDECEEDPNAPGCSEDPAVDDSAAE